MKKFKQLLYTGIAIIGIPFMIIIMATFFAIAHNIRKPNMSVDKKEKPKVDTIVVEKRVVVRDTVYIKPKPTSKPTTVQDTL